MAKQEIFNKYGVVVDRSVEAAMEILYQKMKSSVNGLMKHNAFTPAEMMILRGNAVGMLEGLFSDHIIRNQMIMRQEDRENNG